jgi:hypothetical protein
MEDLPYAIRVAEAAKMLRHPSTVPADEKESWAHQCLICVLEWNVKLADLDAYWNKD